MLRKEVLDEYKNISYIPWPPSPQDLINSLPDLPQILIFFIKSLIRKKSNKYNEKCEMLSEFIAQDICYACTHGKWMLPKQVHLGTSVKHITGSAQSIQFLNQCGHCPSNSFLLELETARYDEIEKSKTTLPTSFDKSSNGV